MNESVRATFRLNDPEALTQLPDEALMAMIAQDDEQALGVLYDRYGRLVYSLALHITDDLVVAEEVTQDVFQRVWTAADAFRASCSDHSWIVAITCQYAGHCAPQATERPQPKPGARG